MSLDRIISQVVRLVLNRVVKKGVDAGFGMLPGREGRGKEQSPEERAQSKEAREAEKRARQMVKLSRRLGR